MTTKKIHMIGICGTGMGSLAVLLKKAKFEVTGSDQDIYPPMSVELEKNEIPVFKGYSAENIKKAAPDMVVIGNVISKGNPEADEVINEGIRYLSMPEALTLFFIMERRSIVVAGTHGKTTTSTLCAWLLEALGYSPGFMIGGVGNNLKTSAKIGKPPYFVVEGDEYDTAFFDKGPKFLHYRASNVILGPVEFDHADIYRDLSHVMSSFEKLVERIPGDGLLVACADSENTVKLSKKAKCKVVMYGAKKNDGYYPTDVKVSPEGTEFILWKGVPRAESRGGSKACQRSFKSSQYGDHNLQNTVGVLALLMELGDDPVKLGDILPLFEGIKRRQEIKGVAGGVTVIDDFAHHPTAIRETIHAMKLRYPSSRLISIFEPRSNTSKRNTFQKEFPAAFKESDMSVIAGLFKPEKVPEKERLDVNGIISEINAKGGTAYTFENTDKIIEFVAKTARNGDVVLLMSNGGFDNIHEKILKRLK